jgi:hypothetical protein
MQHVNDRYLCDYCGELIDIGRDEVPREVLHGSSGQKTVRVLSVAGTEVHRCDVVEPRFGRAPR